MEESTRVARGMFKTYNRAKTFNISIPASDLALNGTTDQLAWWDNNWYDGENGRKLSECGKERLLQLRGKGLVA